MNELLKLDENGNQFVSARELHADLEVGRDFSNWIKDRIGGKNFYTYCYFSALYVAVPHTAMKIFCVRK